MKETIEHNNRFYGEGLKTESEQYKEWLVIANKEIERLTKIANALEKELIDTYEFETGDTTHIKEVIKQIKEEI